MKCPCAFLLFIFLYCDPPLLLGGFNFSTACSALMVLVRSASSLRSFSAYASLRNFSMVSVRLTWLPATTL